jgi:type III secretion system YscQ/HrcQ family protein
MDARREPRPFPFERLKRVSRSRLFGLRRVARCLGSPGTIAAEATALLGASVVVERAPLEHCPPGRLGSAVLDPLVAVVLSHESGTSTRLVALELEPRLAASVIDRALGGTGGVDVPSVVVPLTDVERGALAYVAARLAAPLGLSFVVRGVVTSPAALMGVLGDDGSAVQPARVEVGEDVGFARLWLPDSALDTLMLGETRGATEALRRVPVTIVLDAAWGELSTDELEALHVGDVVLLDGGWLAPSHGGFEGSVRGRIAGARRMELRCALEGDRTCVTAIDVGVDLGVTKGQKMDSDTTTKATERAADAPLEISVEIARFTMPLSEVGALAPGEVLATGQAIGGRVTLRANGAAVATGELVDVDGEVGVRILSLGA